ncbi:MAG TPA: SufD family Fe-S cluster assembly protein [Phycisphaerae bacterium]|nr:SufD family Fe-S cluster assembly protein [Phycisphaerae bacterium]
MTDQSIVRTLYESIGMGDAPPQAARVIVHHNRVLGTQLVPGFEVQVEEKPDGISAVVTVKEGVRIAQPVHMCFGMLPEKGLQRIELRIRMEQRSAATLLAHCTFPNAVDVTHAMDAEIVVEDGAEYSYLERHVHGPAGGVLVLPKARIRVGDDARFKTEFQLVQGRVGTIEVDYEAAVGQRSVLEMVARISGRGTDQIKISEAAHLCGEHARGVLTSYIAVRDEARCEVRNTLVACAPYARGHVDCKEIVQDNASAKAVPVVDVQHSKAHVTHEAAIGSVDTKQLETLMSRGLTEEEAVELIIQGLLT